MGAAEVELRVRILTAAELEPVYDALLAPAFPATELESLTSLAGRITAGTAEVSVGELDGDALAVAVTEPLAPSRARLLTYFATHPARRGGGIGGRMLTAVTAMVLTTHRPSLLVGEVELPAHHGAESAHGDPVARLRFYERHGARLLDVAYFQPSIGPGLPPVYGMALIALAVDPALEDAGRVDATEVAAMMTALVGEGAVGVDAPVVAEILRRAADPAGVRLLPLDQIVALPVVLPPPSR